MDKPLVSIIMPVYNAEKYLEESVQSILSQTYKNFELIIIDDKSADNSKSKALELAKKDIRIKIIDNRYNKGLPGALNSGIDACRGKYIARADGDDINRPYRLSVQVEFLNKHKDIDIVGGGYQLFGNNSNRKIFHPSNSLKLAWKFISNTYFCHPTVMFRKKILETVPHYPEVACEDFAFFSKILKSYEGFNIKKILIDYRQHNTNYSNTDKNPIEKSVLETYKENYIFYTGTLEYVDIFYEFQVKHNLKFKNIIKIIKISFIISKNILWQHKIPRYSLRAFYLYFIVKIDILKTFIPYTKKIYKVMKKILNYQFSL